MTMNDGRKVDKSLYKDILVDIATYQGMDASGITDTDVDDIWESTGGDPTRLMEKISINLGGTAGDVTEDTMNNLFGKYNVVDPNYTKSMMDYMTDDVKKSLLPEGYDERQEFRLDTSIRSVEDWYKSKGELTPFQKNELFTERVTRKSIQLGEGGENELNEYARRVADSVGMVYDPDSKTYVVPREELERYGVMLEGTYMDPRDADYLAPDIDQMYKKLNKVSAETSAVYEETSGERAKKRAETANKAVAIGAGLPGAGGIAALAMLQKEGASMNAAQLFNDMTRKNLDLAKKLKEGGNQFLSGAKEGIVDHFSAIAMTMSNVGRDSKMKEVNDKLGDIYNRVLQDHPELRSNTSYLSSDGEVIPPDTMMESSVKEAKLNDMVSSIAMQEMTPEELNLLESFSVNARSLEVLGEQTGQWFDIGKMTGESVGFMVEFAMSGAVTGGVRTALTSGASKLLSKATATNLVKTISSSSLAKTVSGAASKVASTKIASGAGKLSSRVAKSAFDSSVQVLAQPTFYSRVSNDVANGMPVNEALFNNYYDLVIENFTERIFVGKAPKATGVRGGGNLLKRGFDQFMYRGGYAGYGQRGFSGWVAGTIGEMGEEKVGDLIRGGFTAIDRGESGYLTREIYKPEDLNMVYSIGLMSLGFGAVGLGVNAISKQPSMGKTLYKSDSYGKKLPSALKEKIDNLMNDGTLTLERRHEAIANEINSAIDGYYDEATKGGEVVKKRKDLAHDAIKYFQYTSMYKNMELVENYNEIMDDKNFQAEGDKFILDGKEVTATENVVEEGKIEVEDAEGNVSVVDYDALTPIQENNVEQGKIKQDASETREVRSEGEGTEQQVRKESEPVGGVSEVDGTESTLQQQEEKVSKTPLLDKLPMNEAVDWYSKNKNSSGVFAKDMAWARVKASDAYKALSKEEKRQANKEFNENHDLVLGDNSPYIKRPSGVSNITPKDNLGRIKTKVNRIASSAYTKGASDLKGKIRQVREAIKGSEKLLSQSQYKSIMSSLSRGINSRAQFESLINKINKYVTDQQAKFAVEERESNVNKARSKVNKSSLSQERKEKVNRLLDMDPGKMSQEDLALRDDIISDIIDGRFSETTDYLIDRYPEEVSNETVKGWNLNSVRKYISNIGDRLDVIRENLVDMPTFNEVNKYMRSLTNIRNKVARMASEGAITPEEVTMIGDMIDEFMNGDMGLNNVSKKVREGIEQQVNMELDDATLLHPTGGSPLSYMVDIMDQNRSNIPTLTNAQLSRMYNSLYNLNNGYTTRELAKAMEDLIRHDVKGSMEGDNGIVAKVKRAADSRKFKKFRQDSERLRAALGIRDLNTAEYLLWTRDGTPIYDNIVAKYMEPATVRAHVEQAKLLEPWNDALNKFMNKYTINARGRLHNYNIFTSRKGINLRNLAAMLMKELDYQTNTIGDTIETVDVGERSYFKYLYEKAVKETPMEAADMKGALQYYVYHESGPMQGAVDVEATLKNLGEDEVSVRRLMGAARQVLDNLKEINMANASFRGTNPKFYESNYFPSRVRGGRMDLSSIDALEQMTKDNYNGNIPSPTAVHARRGGIHSIDYNLANVITKTVEEATLDFYVVHPYNGVVNAFNDEIRGKELRDNPDARMILQEWLRTIKNRVVSAYHLDNLNNGMGNMWNKLNQEITSAARVTLLVNVPKMATEMVTNIGGAIISDGISVNPVTMIKNVFQLRNMRDAFEYYGLPETSTVSKLSELARESYGKKKSLNEKAVDYWIRTPDIITSSNMYMRIFNKRFKELNGEDWDGDKWQADVKYRKATREAFRVAHLDAVKRTQESFSTILPVSQAHETRALPFWVSNIIGIGKKNISRESINGRWIGFMLSFAIKEVEMMGIGWRKMIAGAKDGNAKLFNDGFTMLISRLVRSQGYNITKPAISTYMGYLLATGGDGDEEEVANQIVDKMLRNGSTGLAGMFFGRYSMAANLAHSFFLGAAKYSMNEGYIDSETYDLIERGSGYISYARGQTPLSMNGFQLIQEILPAIGIFVNTIGNNIGNMADIYQRAQDNEPLSESQQDAVRMAADFFELMTFIIPNVLTANVRTALRDEASFLRRQDADDKRWNDTGNAFKSNGLAW